MLIEYKKIKAELKANSNERTVEGYAATFNVVDTYNDIILPGAFSQLLQAGLKKVKFLWNHNWLDMPLGHTVDLVEDAKGLWFKAFLPPEPTMESDRFLSLVEHQTIEEMSFAYYVDEYSFDEAGHRLIKSFKSLIEVSGVLWGANDQTSVQVVGAKAGLSMLAWALENIAGARAQIESALRQANRETPEWDVEASQELVDAFNVEFQRFKELFNGVEQ